MGLLNRALLRAMVVWHQLRTHTSGQSGQTLAEYSLIITAIATAVVVLALFVFRDAVAGAFESVVNCVESLESCAP